MNRLTLKLLIRVGMFAFIFASIGAAIAIYADLQGYMYWAKVGFIIAAFGIIVGGLVVFSGIVMNLASIACGGIESLRWLRTHGISATIEEAKRRYRAERDANKKGSKHTEHLWSSTPNNWAHAFHHHISSC